jgi:hypothetical protein
VKETTAERIEALRALIRIADTEFLDGKLDCAIGEDEIDVVAADLLQTVDRRIRWLSAVIDRSST